MQLDICRIAASCCNNLTILTVNLHQASDANAILISAWVSMQQTCGNLRISGCINTVKYVTWSINARAWSAKPRYSVSRTVPKLAFSFFQCNDPNSYFLFFYARIKNLNWVTKVVKLCWVKFHFQLQLASVFVLICRQLNLVVIQTDSCRSIDNDCRLT